MPALPSGTVTFLFSDIEHSTRLLQHLGDRYADVLAEYRRQLRETFQAWDGHEIDTASGEEAAVRRAHANYSLALVEVAEPALTGPGQATWLDRLAAEHDNLRAGLRWTEESGEVEIGLRLAGALCQFWLIRGHLREGQEWLARLLGLAGASAGTAARAKALMRAGHLAHNLGNFTAARALFEESLALCRELGDKHGLAECLEGLAGVAVAQGHLAHAARLLGAAAALREAIGAPLSPHERVRYDRDVSTVQAGLEEVAFAAAWAMGKAMPPEQVIIHGS